MEHLDKAQDSMKTLQVLRLTIGEIANLDGRETIYTRAGGGGRIAYKDFQEDFIALSNTGNYIRDELRRALMAQGLVYVDYRGPEVMSPCFFCPVVWISLPDSPATSLPGYWDRVTVRLVVNRQDTVVQHLVLTPFQFQSFVWRLRACSLSTMHIAMYRRDSEEDGNQKELWEEKDIGLRVPPDAAPVATVGLDTPMFDIHWTRDIKAPHAVYPGHVGRRLTVNMMQQLLERLVITKQDQVLCITQTVDEKQLERQISAAQLEQPRGEDSQRRARSIKHLADSIPSALITNTNSLTTRGLELPSFKSWIEEAISLNQARIDRMDEIYLLDASENTGIRSVDDGEFTHAIGDYGMVMNDLTRLFDMLTHTPFRNALERESLVVADASIRQLRALLCRSAVNFWTIFVGRGNDMYSDDLSPLASACSVPVCPCGVLTHVGLPMEFHSKSSEWNDIPDGLWAQAGYEVVLNHQVRRKSCAYPDNTDTSFTKAALRTVQDQLRAIMSSGLTANDRLQRAIVRDLEILRSASRQCPNYRAQSPQDWIARSLSYEEGNPWCTLWCDLSPMRCEELIRRADGTAVRPKYVASDGSVEIDEDEDELDSGIVRHRFAGFNYCSLAGGNVTGV